MKITIRKKRQILRLDEAKRTETVDAITRWHGNISHAAIDLGVSTQTIYNRLRKWGMTTDQFRLTPERKAQS